MARTRTRSKPRLDPARNPTFEPAGDGSMEYLCLVYQDDKKLSALSEAELDSIVAGCIAWIEDLEQTGRHVLSAGLQSVRSAVTLHDSNGRISATDGPFAETKEHLGGFTIIRARDLNEAIAIASKLPAMRTANIEVRPLLKPGIDLTDALDRHIAASIRRCTSGASNSGSSDRLSRSDAVAR
jgi:hypothetical protein